MRWIWIAVVAMFGLTACFYTPPRPWERQTQFNPADYAAYDKPAGSSITGQVFLKTRGGDVKFGAGNYVYLDPVTPYYTEWFEHTVLRNFMKPDPDTRTHAYRRETRADGEGRFTFENLPAGDYYIACNIRWMTGDGTTGGIAHEKVHVDAGQQLKNVIVTR
jgi:hypothetical protein